MSVTDNSAATIKNNETIMDISADPDITSISKDAAVLDISLDPPEPEE